MIYFLQDKDLNNTSARLRVWGPDANSYLQGQFTQDLRLKTGESAYGLWLDLKGKTLADSQVLKQAENDYLVVSFSISAPALQARLEAYLIADEVELADQTAAWESILLWGEGAAALAVPPGVLVWTSRRAGATSRQWLVPAAQGAAVIAELKKSATESNPVAAELERLRAAVPAVPADIGPRELPNEGGLDEVAISYTKGCYLGQEVMARLKNLGQVRRRLHVIRGAGSPPAPGTALYQGARKVGETRSAAPDGNEFIAMALVSLVNLDTPAGLSLAPDATPSIRIVRHV